MVSSEPIGYGAYDNNISNDQTRLEEDKQNLASNPTPLARISEKIAREKSVRQRTMDLNAGSYFVNFDNLLPGVTDGIIDVDQVLRAISVNRERLFAPNECKIGQKVQSQLFGTISGANFELNPKKTITEIDCLFQFTNMRGQKLKIDQTYCEHKKHKLILNAEVSLGLAGDWIQQLIELSELEKTYWPVDQNNNMTKFTQHIKIVHYITDQFINLVGECRAPVSDYLKDNIALILINPIFNNERLVKEKFSKNVDWKNKFYQHRKTINEILERITNDGGVGNSNFTFNAQNCESYLFFWQQNQLDQPSLTMQQEDYTQEQKKIQEEKAAYEAEKSLMKTSKQVDNKPVAKGKVITDKYKVPTQGRGRRD